MNNQFNSMYKDILAEHDVGYAHTVDVNVYLDGGENIDYDSTHKTSVRFIIDLETRSWGIKGITVSPISIQPIEVEIVDTTGGTVNVTITLNIDPRKLKTERSVPEHYVGVGSINIHADVNGSIDYNRSTIEIFGF